MSLPIDEILAILRDGNHITSPTALQAAAKDLIAAEKEVKESKADSGPKAKTRLVALVRLDVGERTVTGGAYIIAVPDDDAPESATYHGEALLNRLRTAATQHNDAPRGRRKAKVKVDTWATLFRHVKAKTFKESGSAISLRAKGEPVEVIVLEREGIAPQ